MRDPLSLRVGVIPQKEFRSLGKGGGLMASATLREVLAERFETAALFCTYYVEGKDRWPRLRKRGTDLQWVRDRGGQVFTSCLVFDFDRPKVEGHKQPWESAEEPAEVLAQLLEADLQPTAFYSTKHGARIIYVLDRPLPVEQGEGAYQIMLRLLQQAGVHSDENTADWTRFFVAPFVTKEETKLWELDYIWVEEFDAVLSADWVLQQGTVPQVIELEGDAPDEDTCARFLETLSRGKVVATDFVRQAKKRLQNSPYFDVIFHESPPPWPDGERNSGLWKLVGHVTHRLWGCVEELTHVHVFALLRALAGRMEPSADDPTPYVEKLWDMVCRTWEKHHDEQEVERATTEQVMERALMGMRAQARTHGEPLHVLAAKRGLSEIDWMREHLIAQCGNETYLMGPDGYYTSRPIRNLAGIQGAVKHLGLEDLYGLVDRDGEIVGREELLKQRAFAVGEIRLELGLRQGELRDLDQPLPTLALPSHYLRPEKAQFVPIVDTYLRTLAGDNYERLVDWLAFAQDVHKPICALSLCGASNTGKTFMAELIGARFGPGQKNGDEVFGAYNGGLVRNPVINFDEGATVFKNAKAADEVFRTYVTGGTIPVKEKYLSTRQAEVYPRIIIGANNIEALRAVISGRDLDDASYDALSDRVLHIEVRPEAALWLSEHGGRELTNNWLYGDRLALRHLAWLYENRPTRSRWSGSGRLLVEGERHSEVLEDMRWSTPEIEAVMRAILRAVRVADTRGSQAILLNCPRAPGGVLLVNSNGLLEFMGSVMDHELRQVNLTLRKIGGALNRLSMQGKPDWFADSNGGKRRWKQINPEKLIRFAMQYGIECPATLLDLYVVAHGEKKLDALLEEFQK